VAEDDPAFLRAMAVRFGSEGLDVITASDAYQALERARHDRPDVIVLDVNIPAGDGFSVHERLRSMGLVSAPVIYVTGEKSVRVDKLSKKLGAFAVIHKPCEPDELMTAVREALAT
jgi:DNA-binding response OmpR family regulator